MMELGALICEAGAPRCGSCPVSAECKARGLGDPTAFPQFVGVKKWLDVEDVSVAVRNAAGEVLIVQRSPDLALWGGLWELPRATRQDGEALAACAARAACESVGVTVQALTPFGVVKHGVANRRITLHGYEAAVTGDAAPTALGCARFAWVTRDSLAGYALATPQTRLTELLWRHESQGRLEF